MIHLARRIVPAAVLLTAASGLVHSVDAQQFSVSRTFEAAPGSLRGSDSGVSARSLTKYAGLLGLDEAQVEAAGALRDALSAELQSARKQMRDKVSALETEGRSTGSFASVMPQIVALGRELSDKEDSLEKGFFSDLRSLLSPAQAAQWPRVEMAHRRLRNTARASLSGESVDLVGIVDGLKLTAPLDPALVEAMTQYELDFDRACARRDEALDAASREAEQAGRQGGGGVAPEILPLIGVAMPGGMPSSAGMARVREASKGIVEVNQRYVRLVEPLLPDDHRAAFLAAVQQRTFPSVYRPSRAESSLERASKFEDLTPRQRDDLASVREAHFRAAASLNDAWARAIREQEEQGGGAMMLPGGGIIRVMGGPDVHDSPLDKARQARRELDQKTQSRLEGMLSDDQKGRLPKAPERTRALLGGGDWEMFEEGSHLEARVIVVEGQHDVLLAPGVEAVPEVPVPSPAPETPER